jgi:hypothetical protein
MIVKHLREHSLLLHLYDDMKVQKETTKNNYGWTKLDGSEEKNRLTRFGCVGRVWTG